MQKSAISYLHRVNISFILLILMEMVIIQSALPQEISGKLLDPGHINEISLLKNSGDRLLSRDSSGIWILWRVNDRRQIMKGESTYYDQNDKSYKMDYIDLRGNTLAVSNGNNVKLISAKDGNLLTNIPINTRINLVGLSVDGTYFWTATNSYLSIWSLFGSKLLSVTGNYSKTRVFADTTNIKIANGPSGTNIIETISLENGNLTKSPSFMGSFHSWFLDGNHFITTIGTVVYVYSSSSEQKALIDSQSTKLLGGSGAYFWIGDESNFKIYKIGNGNTHILITGAGTSGKVISMGNRIALLPYSDQHFTTIQLNPDGIIKTTHQGPGAYLSSFGADWNSSWSVGNGSGVIYDNLSVDLPFEEKSFGYGRIRSIAGSKSGVVATATANGQILFFNINDNEKSLDRKLQYDSSNVKLSENGSILAVQDNFDDSNNFTDKSLTIFSLPTDSVIRKWVYFLIPNSNLIDFDLSLNGVIASRKEKSGSQYKNLVNKIESGELMLSVSGDAITAPKLSPDGSGAAISDGYTLTKIYENGQLSTAINGGFAGWIDNLRLLINTYKYNKLQDRVFDSSYIYNREGILVSKTSLPEIISFTAITDKSILSHKHNAVFDLQTRQTLWTASDTIMSCPVGYDYIVCYKKDGLYWYKWTANLLPTIILLSPNGGESLRSGKDYLIKWSAWGPDIHHIRLLYSTDGGNTYPYTITGNTNNDGIYEWTIPELDSSTIRVKAMAEDSNSVMLSEDTSDSNFIISKFLLKPITDLKATQGILGNTIILEWTAPDNIASTDQYVIRYNTTQITDSNWDESLDIDGEPTPGPVTSKEKMTVNMTYPGITYYFAIKIRDEKGYISEISNSPHAIVSKLYLHAGWNLVSFIPQTVISMEKAMSSISGKYESIWKYETPNSSWSKYIAGGPSILNDLKEIGPGYGYWINVKEDCTWDYGGAYTQSPSGLMLRKPPFILYGKITKDGFLIDNNEGHEVSIIIKNKKVSSYILNSNPRYEDYYVFEIPVDDSFREGDMAQLYVDGQQTNEAPLILGGIGKVRRYDLKYISIPADTNLLQNYPNPFNPDTWIPYQLKEDSNVVIRIYNATGLLVRSLNIGYRQRGFYISKDRAAYWDGRNEADELVASGIYFYTIQTGKYTSIRKMLLMK